MDEWLTVKEAGEEGFSDVGVVDVDVAGDEFVRVDFEGVCFDYYFENKGGVWLDLSRIDDLINLNVLGNQGVVPCVGRIFDDFVENFESHFEDHSMNHFEGHSGPYFELSHLHSVLVAHF